MERKVDFGENYYWPFYKNYIEALRGAKLPESEMIYINKYYWNIALLICLRHDFEDFTDIREFCKET